MRAHLLSLLAALTVLFAAGCGDDDATKPEPPAPIVQPLLETIRSQSGMPAMAAVLLNEDGVIDRGYAGVRKLGESEPVAEGDLYDVGSNVKAMTAALFAFEVREGRVSWSTTLGEIWPAFADSMAAPWPEVTVTEVLQHRAGLPAWENAEDIFALPGFPGEVNAQRQTLARWLLVQAPAFPRGEFHYSNAGYALAGAMLEEVSGESWEHLLDRRLLNPLGMAGTFGWPAANGAHQPWGHVDDGAGGLVPFDPDGPLQFPPLLRPMGNLSLSAADYAEFALLNLRGLRGRDGLLPAPVIRQLHDPNGEYALGWGVQEYRGRTVSYHLGSAGVFAAAVMIDPQSNRAAVVLANAGNAQAEDAALQLAVRLIDR